ncbi:MAG: MetQ/NlpA family ABC transporter substrate-binding protein [Oscillospiraceae bacterium]|nr:MetQ/NlpA family ABC transporter substrate-binding protein [Oscillospiraceae bacterium]
MSIRNKFAFSLTAVLAAVSLTACSGGTTSSSSSASNSELADCCSGDSSSSGNSSAAESSEADSAATESETAYSPENPVTVRIGLTGNIYEDIWDPIKEKLAPEGIIIEYEQFTSFNIPNNALANGEIEMNAFQHHAYFNNDVASNGYDITPIGDTFIVAMNIYTSKGITIEDALASTETLKIAVPNDVTNEGRALRLLESAGFFNINDGAGASPEITDISEYAVPVEFVEVDANLVYSVIDDVDLAVINGNYALDSGLSADDAIFKESEYADNSYYCLIAVRTEDKDNPVYKRIVEEYQTQDTIDIYNTQFKGFFVPAWTLG